MALSSLTPSEYGYLYRDQTTTLRLALSAAGVSSWPAAPVLHVGELAIAATIDTDDVAVWQVTESQTEGLSRNTMKFWITLDSGVGAVQIMGGILERVEHGAAAAGAVGLNAQVIIGPTGQSAYQAAVAGGFEGTEAEWLESLGGIHAVIDPDNPDLLLITYPTYATAEDGHSILIPLEV